MAPAAERMEPFAAVIVAAGSGTRYGQPKHELELGGKPLWQWSVDVFEESGAAEVVVVGDVPGGIGGGRRRRDSVRAGLEALTSGAPVVLIHDAARPLVSLELVKAVRSALADRAIDGAIPAVPVTDTIKRVDGVRIVATVARDDLVAVQTPQGFRADALERAHLECPDDDATDDAALVERSGGTVVVVNGDRENIKLTFPGDLTVAESFLMGRGR